MPSRCSASFAAVQAGAYPYVCSGPADYDRSHEALRMQGDEGKPLRRPRRILDEDHKRSSHVRRGRQWQSRMHMCIRRTVNFPG